MKREMGQRYTVPHKPAVGTNRQTAPLLPGFLFASPFRLLQKSRHV